jgi:hypothetical protein
MVFSGIVNGLSFHETYSLFHFKLALAHGVLQIRHSRHHFIRKIVFAKTVFLKSDLWHPASIKQLRSEMKAFQIFACITAACTLVIGKAADGGTNVTIGQWDFDNGDLTATVGQPLQYLNGTTTSAATTFKTFDIAGQTAHVMGFPGAAPDQGYIVTHGAQPNGGGTNVNEYSLIMDIMFPSESDGSWRSILQTGSNDASDDAEILINPLNRVGFGSAFFGELPPDTWKRLAITVDVTNNLASYYIDGVPVGSQSLNTTVDSEWSLRPTFLLFTDNNFDTAPGYVNSIQFRSEVLTPEAVAALGAASAGGIGTTPPAGEFTLGINRAQGVTKITFSTSGTYQLQSTTNIANPTWQNLGSPVTGTNAVITTSSKKEFFRAQKIQ